MSERDIWFEALEEVMFCVPPDVRLDVLRRLTNDEVERQERPFRMRPAEDFDPAELKYWNAGKEAASLIIQVLVRTITSNHSLEDAGKILFRDHGVDGTGSGWLPDYLQGIPGIKVDRKRCIAISDSNGESKLVAARHAARQAIA